MSAEVGSLRNGDVLLFKGNGGGSRLIKVFTRSDVTHAGLVFRCPITDVVYVWETGDLPGGSGPLITVRNSIKLTAHLVPLSTRIKAYDGEVYVKRLLHDGKSKELDEVAYARFIKSNLGRKYPVTLVSSWNQRGGASCLPLPFLDAKGTGDWMCAELVARTLDHLGVMVIEKPPHTVMPVDLWKEEGISMRPGYQMSKPLHVSG